MHKVELRKGFSGDRRNRAGITVTRTDIYEGELSDEQLAAIKADPELVVTGIEREVQDKAKRTRTTAKKTSSAKSKKD